MVDLSIDLEGETALRARVTSALARTRAWCRGHVSLRPLGTGEFKAAMFACGAFVAAFAALFAGHFAYALFCLAIFLALAFILLFGRGKP